MHRLQSRLVLLLVVPTAAVWLVELLGRAGGWQPKVAALAVAGLLATATRAACAATPWAAATGGLLAACFALTPPGWHSGLWVLLTTLVLTLGATKLAKRGRAAGHEARHGRTSAQVAANLGVAALAGTLTFRFGEVVALAAMLSALAEAAADTVSSEVGQRWGGTPRLLTTWKAVPPGTDGAVSVLGTAWGCGAACAVAAAGVFTLRVPLATGMVAAAAGVAGLVFDSLLGATVEREDGLGNDAVNFLSTLFSALLGVVVALRVFPVR